MKLLRVTPEKNIEFPLVHFQAVTQVVKLENISDRKVAFKIKTTAPNNYLVRPSFGLINVRETIDIQIILQPLSDKDNISNDKFQVQCLNVDNDTTVDKQFWVTVNKSEIQDHKLVVVLNDESSSKLPHSYLPSNNNPISEMNHKNHNLNYTDTSINPDDGLKGSLPSMQRKYHELLNYCVFVDKQKVALEKENESLKNQLKAYNNNCNKFFIDSKLIPVIIVIIAIVTKSMGYW
ncbi:vesicle-associated membrane protein, putative [Plasmodium berghei]|uniref:Vesicle-associated membrane protein, putative n=2 Tax=Plasmodium berghei TaxID=5821 RepID=A0A509APK6_PLABA|nr:vesicle-associated membrane protein, putative [Plasmodium berghei ANKA]CXI88157.1 vesicle-associated membrane protein, putative [Plasmodium berghei]SCL95907.1 vesicle-associated membrane protein, putative [Plasmodium berghei]SCM16312.1 vesicle-associated membrane protein, putative [Plasmodium berghei]SCM18108.1 vesicle-associated membrane protein, putative [Plasmodium berghei]SCN27535.1 vesicle-associated membrane protein, putative [Plasmodium berghei]|eukprot:XP_034423190.1 vesicle-associated membrane protein, putative [Plasmodium berghei ANKA]